jgi:hypothetical protein
VYPVLPSTTCPRPADFPARALISDQAFADFVNSEDGRDWFVADRAAFWECFDKLGKVRDEQRKWPAPGAP